MIEFTIHENIPTTTAQQRKIAIVGGTPTFYDPPALKTAKELLTVLLSTHRPRYPMEGPLELTVEWRFASKSHKNGTWRYTRPDIDNLMKSLQDCMTKLRYWNDDSQIVAEHISKYWSNDPGLYIKIRELPKERKEHD